jgi:tRNA(Ile)-lysidine synthase
MEIEKRVASDISKYSLIRPKEKVLVGVSGGPDSVCLLYLLKRLNFCLHIAHLDHMLRGDSADDCRFVKGLAKRLNIPITCARINVKQKARGYSLEEAARNARIDFLLKTAAKVKAKKIALGHNLDDQAETVLMRIIRGTGLSGLSGILFKRRIRNIDIIRPLLGVKRAAIESYLKAGGIRFRTDKTNTDEAFLRNKVRHKLLPNLEKEYNKNIKELLSNLAQNAGGDYDFISASVSKLYRIKGERLRLDRLCTLPLPALRMKLREAIAFIQKDTRRITFKHIRELEDLVFNRPQGSVVDLPRGISAAKDKNCLKFYLR